MATAVLQIPGRNAQFIGTGTLLADGTVHCVTVVWSQPGDSAFYNDHVNSPDVVNMTVSVDTLKRDIIFLGDPTTIPDASYQWSATDFAGVV